MKQTFISKFSTVLFVLLCFTIFNARGQTVTFSFNDDTSSEYNIDDIRYILFEQDSLYLHLQDGSVFAWAIDAIGQMNFDEDPLSVEVYLDMVNTYDFLIFPNPAKQQLNVQCHLAKQETISLLLYDLQGKLLLTKDFGLQEPGVFSETIDISFLSSGSYQCHFITNHVKITKTLIKQ